MFLEFANNNGTRYIRVVESVRVTKDGKRVTRKKTIKNIGPVSRFSDGMPDYEARLKASFLAGKPLIADLLPYVPKAQPLETYSFQITEGSEECIGHPRLYAQCLLDRLMSELGVSQVVQSYKGFSNIQFDLLGYLKLLVFGRILEPASKLATVSQNKRYYEPVTDDAYEYHVYDTLDFIYLHRRQILNRINSVLGKLRQRKTDLIYYDVTNFYFETDTADEDLVAEDGTVILKGLRKFGVSKENRKNPIVQMGLFMDNAGIPISIEVFPGNTLDHLTVKDALKASVDNMNFGRFVFVGDRGMCSYFNLLHILSCGNGYVVSKSLAKSTKQEKAWAFDDSDYTVQSENFKYKSRIVTKNVKDENGQTVQITEKVVCYWDKYFYERQYAENRSFLDFLEKLKLAPERFRITAAQSKAVRKFLKHEYIDLDSGELMKASRLRAVLDYDKIEQFKREMGYYQIVTSELQLTEKEVIDIYHGLSRIEDQFRVMKSSFDTRPIFVRTPEHIEAHLTLCTIALIIMRIIQKRVCSLTSEASKHSKCWSYGISAERIQRALNDWTVDMLPGDLYRFNNLDDPDLKLILDAFNLQIPKKLFRRQELKRLKGEISLSNQYID